METHNLEETVALGARLAPRLAAGDILLLRGPLGAGKTAFVRGIVTGIDAAVAPLVTSQSYVVVGEYPTSPRVTHLDLYRLSHAEEVLALGYEELLYGDDRLACVEWPELLEPLLESDDPVLRLTLARTADPDTRTITAASDDPRLLQAFAAAVGVL